MTCRYYSLLLVVLLTFIVVKQVESTIWPLSYTSEIVVDSPGSFQVAPNTWSNQSPGNGRSYIKVDANLSIADPDSVNLEEKPANLDFIFLKNSEYKNLGSPVGVASVLCCTTSLKSQGKCSQVGTVILQNEEYQLKEYESYNDVIGSYKNIQVHHITIKNISSLNDNIYIPIEFNVTDPGLYNILVISCWKLISPEYTDIQVKGSLIFMNPFGYLSGDKFPLLYSNLVLALFYVGLGILWLYFSFRYKNTLLQIHYWIALAILLGFLESIVNYTTLSKWNKVGHFSIPGLVFTTLFGTLKRSFGRSLVLLVSMGYSIIVPTISRNNKLKIVGLTILYSILRYIQYYIENYPTPSNGAQISYIFLTLPVSVLDALFYWWIFLSFMETMKIIKERNQPIKLSMFRNFLYILVSYAGIVVFLIVVEMIINWAASVDTIFTAEWVFDIIWNYTYFIILIAICKIWRPSENNQKYAYSELQTEDNDIAIHSIDELDNNNNDDNNNFDIETKEEIVSHY